MFFLFFLFVVAGLGRPPLGARKFDSVAVDKYIKELKLKDPKLEAIFTNAMPNSLDTTVSMTYNKTTGLPETFIITGDINAMWLRDSCNQVLPYLRFVKEDEKLRHMFEGLIRRQVDQVLIDGFANAFSLYPNSEHSGDVSYRLNKEGKQVRADAPLVFERKFEIDSLCAFLKLSNHFFLSTNSVEVFQNSSYLQAVETVVSIFEQRQQVLTNPPDYTFMRQTTDPLDTLVKTIGAPYRYTGMLASPFRPSDDATTFPFLVPANAMAVVELRQSLPILAKLGADAALMNKIQEMANTIDEGIKKWGIVKRMGKEVYAYEVDGFGNELFMDDANIPSLLSLPYLGYVNNSDPVYQNTREFILHESTNPYYFEGTNREFYGIGSVHTSYGHIWPMALLMRALTSNNVSEVLECIDQVKKSASPENLMYESFNVNDPSDATRPWFAWCNSLFGETIMRLVSRYPSLFLKETK